MFSAMLITLAAAGAQIDLPTQGVSDAPVISAPPPPVAPVVIRGRGGPTAPFSVERISHATVLFDFDGARILTDPWFTEAPEYHHGEPLAVSAAHLPKLAAIIVSHAHFDHFDVEHFGKTFPDKSVPMFVGFDDMVARARQAGFTNVRKLTPGTPAMIGNVKITALPGRHVVPEITYLLESGGNKAYFGADTMLAPEVRTIAQVGPVDVAFLPTNGLNVGGKPAVMSSEEAAVMAGLLRTAVAIPIHYRFKGGPKTEGTMLTYNGTPDRFVRSVAVDAPMTKAVVLEPGQVLDIRHER